MRFFEGVRPNAYFQGGRLKKDAKSGVRYWLLTFAITLEGSHVYRCDEFITSNFEQISAIENRCEELGLGVNIHDHAIEFFELAESPTSVLRLAECSMSHLRMTQVDGLTELWITVEAANGDALHKFVKDYAFTRLWLTFAPRQGKLDAIAGDTAVLNALDRFASTVGSNGITSMTLEHAGQSVTIDKAAAERIHAAAKKMKS